MAKLTAPLMSMVASGKFGDAIIFDKRGYARVYTIPANPQSEDQGDVRQKLAAVQAVLKLIITTAKDFIKAAAPTGYRWNSWAVQQCIGTGAAVFDASLVLFNALEAGQKTAWDGSFSDVTVPDIAYKLMADVTSGGAAFCVARGLYLAGAITSPGAPSGTNNAAWATALVP